MLNGHDHLYARYRPLDPSGKPDPRKGIREFIVGTGGETLDAVATVNTTTADPSANPNFNAENLEASSGEFWGVMGTDFLEPNVLPKVGFRVGTAGSSADVKQRFLPRRGQRQLPRSSEQQVVFESFSLMFPSARLPHFFARSREEWGTFFCLKPNWTALFGIVDTRAPLSLRPGRYTLVRAPRVG